ncbi:c-type cytochrome [Nodularia harveyana UHCC-0300]|uniref:C-type cytochrome n=1 Tax=Nodularia harveyana UHCC-0300 TaxID=2974287 RepID=A0ABU5UEU8_9CYAN|nr:c-type cytochrome [Nodularia harveyana]MEA5582017.1 c-type cytochrome [Nodularia harveyana UHCC-0300]
MQRRLILLLVTMFLFINNFTTPAIAAETNHGAEIFSAQCAGCHINGGNIIRRGKNLKKSALERYGMNTIEAITGIVTNGKNNMSAYKDRLTPEQIQEVAAYVLEQAETGWH